MAIFFSKISHILSRTISFFYQLPRGELGSWILPNLYHLLAHQTLHTGALRSDMVMPWPYGCSMWEWREFPGSVPGNWYWWSQYQGPLSTQRTFCGTEPAPSPFALVAMLTPVSRVHMLSLLSSSSQIPKWSYEEVCLQCHFFKNFQILSHGHYGVTMPQWQYFSMFHSPEFFLTPNKSTYSVENVLNSSPTHLSVPEGGLKHGLESDPLTPQPRSKMY